MRQALEFWAAYSRESKMPLPALSAARTSFMLSLYALLQNRIKSIANKLLFED